MMMTSETPFKRPMLRDQYEVEVQLGRGTYGSVYVVKDHNAQNAAESRKAVKVLLLHEDNDKSVSITEAQILMSIQHPNIVKFYDCFYLEKKFYIVMEYCNGLDLMAVLSSLKREEKTVPESQAVMWFVQLLQGINFIHQSDIVHRDVKPRNILVHDNILKLGDFGVSRVLSGSEYYANTIVGTAAYMSPEVVNSDGYNKKFDIWSLGCVLYEIIALKPAFDGKALMDIMINIINCRHQPWPEGYSEELHHIFNRTLTKDPDERPTACDLLNLTYLQQYTQHQGESKEVESDEGMSSTASLLSQTDQPHKNSKSETQTQTQTQNMCNVNFIVRQKEEDMEAIYIDCSIKSKTEERLKDLELLGYNKGPMKSKDVTINNNSTILVSASGSLKLEVDETQIDHHELIFNAESDSGGQEGWLSPIVGRGTDRYRGFIIFSLPDTCSKEKMLETRCSKRITLCTLPVSLKTSDHQHHTALLSDIEKQHIIQSQESQEELWNPIVAILTALKGDEWIILAKELHYETTYISKFQRSELGGYDEPVACMLMDWFRRTRDTPDRMLRLGGALESIGHKDIANVIRQKERSTREERKFRHIVDILTDDANLLREHQHFLRTLGLSDADIVSIHFNQKMSSLKEMVREGMLLWRSRIVGESYIPKLIDTLGEANHKRLAETVSQHSEEHGYT